MEKQKSPLSIRILYWVSAAVIYLMYAAFAAAIIFNILLYTDFFGDNLQLHVEFPAEIDIREKGLYEYQGEEIQIEFVEASSRIHFFNTPVSLARKFGIAMLIAFGLMIFIATQFKNLFKKVKNGIVFNEANIKSLKRIAYGITSFWLFTVLYLWILYYSLGGNIEHDGIRLSSTVPNHIYILVLGAFIWVIAHVFEVGLKLQQDQELTI